MVLSGGRVFGNKSMDFFGCHTPGAASGILRVGLKDIKVLKCLPQMVTAKTCPVHKANSLPIEKHQLSSSCTQPCQPSISHAQLAPHL